MIVTWDRIFQVIGYILGSLLYFVTGMLLEKVKERANRKREYFGFIQKEVFEPILKSVEGRYIPVLSRKYLGIEVRSKFIRDEEGVDQKIIGETPYLEVMCEPQLYINQLSKGLNGVINPYLYEDVKKNHYTELIVESEHLRAQYFEFSEKCIREIERLTELVENRIGFSRQRTYTAQKWIDIYQLSKYILSKQLLMEVNLNIKRTNDLYDVGIYEHQIASRLEESEVLEVKKVFVELSEPSKESKTLLQESSIILKEFLILRDQMYHEIYSKKLKGSCTYI